MKKRISILLILAACLILVSVAWAQSGERDPLTWYTVERTTSSGEGYRLASLTWQVEGTAASSGYIVHSPTGPTLRGNGCCCGTYLPCVLRGR